MKMPPERIGDSRLRASDATLGATGASALACEALAQAAQPLKVRVKILRRADALSGAQHRKMFWAEVSTERDRIARTIGARGRGAAASGSMRKLTQKRPAASRESVTAFGISGEADASEGEAGQAPEGRGNVVRPTGVLSVKRAWRVLRVSTAMRALDGTRLDLRRGKRRRDHARR